MKNLMLVKLVLLFVTTVFLSGCLSDMAWSSKGSPETARKNREYSNSMKKIREQRLEKERQEQQNKEKPVNVNNIEGNE